MNHIETLGLLFIFFFFLNKFLVKKKLFLDSSKKSPHKLFVNNSESIPFSGGLLILVSYIFFFTYENIIFNIFLVLVFFCGILSDLEKLESPIKRIIFQVAIISTYLIISGALITTVRIGFIDNFLEIYIIKLFFTLFCMLILMNGSNFIDGINTLASFYYILILSSVLYVKYNYYLDFESANIELVIISLIVVLSFNFFGKIYLGDNGILLISFFTGVTLIIFVNKYNSISPYFIACLLWYPAYENLFSIIRKKIQRFNPSKPDNKHLHQLLFIYCKKKLKLSNQYTNTLTGILINIFNFGGFLFAVNNHSSTKILTFIILANVIVYTIVYFRLKIKL